MVHGSSRFIVGKDSSRSIAIVVASVELKAIDTIVGLYLLENTHEVGSCLGVGEVVAS